MTPRRTPAVPRRSKPPTRAPRTPNDEQRLQRARLHGMAEMARSLGHEINNTLAAMILRVEMLREDVPATSPAHESVQVLDTATTQGVALVRRVGELARLSRPLVPRPVELGTVVEAALEALRTRGAVPHGVEIAVTHALLPAIPGDRGELTLAIQELLANAIDAVGGRGCITVTTGARGDTLFCRIADDGRGLTDDAAARAFDPFFTTSGARGRGLGLTIAQTVAARHDGALQLAGGAGSGCTATFELPRPR